MKGKEVEESDRKTGFKKLLLKGSRVNIISIGGKEVGA
jgi:hypothetical protein